jgi:hypothetical protein
MLADAKEDAVSAEQVTDPALAEVDKEIDWYMSHKVRNRKLYHSLKALQIIAAALVPVLTSTQGEWQPLIAGLGVFIVAAEGIQQLGHFHQNWVRFALAGEALKRERRLYIARAGDYDTDDTADKPAKLLAERLEDIVSREATDWVADVKPKETASTD